MKILEYLETEPSNDRQCAQDCLEAIIEVMRGYDKVRIKCSNVKTVRNCICEAKNAIYYNTKYVYIPEEIVEKALGGLCYLGIPDIVEVLSHSRYNHRRIVPESFYDVLTIETPIGTEDIDCLLLNYKVLRHVSSALVFGEV